MNGNCIIQKNPNTYQKYLKYDHEYTEKSESVVFAQNLLEKKNCEEMKDIIEILKNNKASSDDSINSELIKIGTQQLVTIMYGLLK